MQPITTIHNVPVLALDQCIVDRYFKGLVQRACGWPWCHPNVITLSSVITTALMIWIHFKCKTSSIALWAVPLLMVYKWFADVMDGPVARACGKTSKIGGVLDTLADYLFTVAVYVMFMDVLGSRRGSRVVLEGAVLSALPFALIVMVNGMNAVHHHVDFKNSDSRVNAYVWGASENTCVVIGTFAVLYMVLCGMFNGNSR